jgi:hypothetical protein
MTTKLALPVVLAGAALAAAGCGGSSSSGTSGGTGTVAGTVATLSTSTTARGSASFQARFATVQRQLQQGLRQLENGNMVGAGAVLRNCTDTVTKQLGARAQTTKQQQAVSDLRTACDAVAQAQHAYGANDTAGAAMDAKRAYRLVQQAGADVR